MEMTAERSQGAQETLACTSDNHSARIQSPENATVTSGVESVGYENNPLSCHDDWRIALYYIYIDLTPLEVDAHIGIQRNYCEEHGLKGRIRVSTEGVNGVLSGTHETLRAYERAISTALQAPTRHQICENEHQHRNILPVMNARASTTDTCNPADGTICILDNNEKTKLEEEAQNNVKDDNYTTTIDLDVKYCRLRKDLPIEKQLFDRLVVKRTTNVIGLFDQSLCGQQEQQKQKRNKSERYRRRRERKREEQEARRCSNLPNQQQQLYSAENKVKSTKNEASSPKSNHARNDNDIKKQQDGEETSSTLENPSPLLDMSSLRRTVMEEPLNPARHLSASEWNEKLDETSSSSNKKSALLLDVRNVYEMKVGHFAHPSTPTLLTNTRKYSDLPMMLASNRDMQERDQIFMYCTGGVRCERVSMLVHELYPDKEIFQLQGGIQRYLEACSEQPQQQEDNQEPHSNQQEAVDRKDGAIGKKNPGYFIGKNFVFDPRRTDPVHFGETVGRCLVCAKPHDDYDNGHSPSDNKEARCNNCRMLILICNDCRPKYRCHGEEEIDHGIKDEKTAAREEKDSSNEHSVRPLLYCNLDQCIHEGSSPDPELRVFTK